MNRVVLLICLIFQAALVASPLLADDTALKDAVEAAARRLADQSSYSWQSTIQSAGGPARGFRAAGGIGGDPTTGLTEKDGYATIKQPGLQFIAKAGKFAVLIDGYWMTLDQAAARPIEGQGRNPGQFSAASVTRFKL